MAWPKEASRFKTPNPELIAAKVHVGDRVIALAGNPNVGKSTVFNALTGLRQHTGNWPGKTVVSAQGYYRHKDQGYLLVDLPGCYSLNPHSAEEEVARNFICFGHPDAVVIVCDALCLERNLNLVLQTLEITPQAVVCVNLIDEARKKRVSVDLSRLAELLGVTVIATAARSNEGLDELLGNIGALFDEDAPRNVLRPIYPDYIETAIERLQPTLRELVPQGLEPRWLSLKLLEDDPVLWEMLRYHCSLESEQDEELQMQLQEIHAEWQSAAISEQQVRDDIVRTLINTAEEISNQTVAYLDCAYTRFDRRLDRILTSAWTGVPIMILALLFVFWLTITGANYPSQLLSAMLFWGEERLFELCGFMGFATWLTEMLVLGIYRVLAWVIAVMLPPMAIFFPLFTLLEDSGYLPRIAFNLDQIYKKCSACGKQALTMCMGFGCNAAGVVGCRIIDSPRERLIAIITNNFVPCNGRFPTLIALISMFFIGTAKGMEETVLSALILTGVILLGILMTFLVSKILSRTILKGVPSSFTLELPPYRRPQIGKVLMRSIFDRTLFVLGRALRVAAPAGIIIWCMANITFGEATLLAHGAHFLDPLGRSLGMDGVILLAFVLGIPANEIVIPLILMSYMAQGSLLEMASLTDLKEILLQNGWTWITAVNVMLFSLMHWPCSTTLLTIKEETQSLKWAFISFLLPTVTGVLFCLVFTAMARIFV